MFWQCEAQFSSSRLWRWWIILDCVILNSPTILQLVLAGVTFMTWNMALESTVLNLTIFAWSLRFLQPKQNFLNYLVTVLMINYAFSFYTVNIFGCFHSVIVQFVLVKHKFSNSMMLYIHLCTFQIVQWSNVCSVHQLSWYYQPHLVRV